MRNRDGGNPVVDPIIGNRVELQLLTTLKCNLKCTYCSLGEGDVLGSQLNASYTLEELAEFIQTHLANKEIYVTFYGGEPTLNLDFMRAVMQRFPSFRFQLQTNGTLLDDVPKELLSRLSNILVSIDGGEVITDRYRGRGIYRQILKHVRQMRPYFGGTVTARVTWSDAEIDFEELNNLTNDFDYVYFQFVAGERYGGDGVLQRELILSQLVKKFFSSTDRIYPFIPLMGIVRNKIFPGRAQELYAGMTQCRSSTHLLNVMPDGKIFPCPDMLYFPNMQQGHVGENWLIQNPLQPHESMPCKNCEAFSWCRRNCMKNLYRGYVENDAQYRLNVVEPICQLICFLGREIDRYDPQNWFSQLSPALRRELTDCEVYEYVEVMP